MIKINWYMTQMDANAIQPVLDEVSFKTKKTSKYSAILEQWISRREALEVLKNLKKALEAK